MKNYKPIDAHFSHRVGVGVRKNIRQSKKIFVRKKREALRRAEES